MPTKPSSLPQWADDVGAVVTEPSSGKKAQGWLAPEKPTDGTFNWWMNLVFQWISWLSTMVSGAGVKIEVLGQLNVLAEQGTLVMVPVRYGFTITEVTLYSPYSGSSGSIQVELFKLDTAGGTPVTMYTSNTEPSIAANDGHQWGNFTGANLPNTTAVADSSLLGIKILSAPDDADGLVVIVR